MAATGDDAAKAAAPPPSPSIIPRMKLGSKGLEVSAQGLGCMGMSAFYGPPKPEADMIGLIHHAVRRGVTFLDTSDIYGPFTNEILLGKAIRQGGLRDQVQLATKFGSRHFEDGTREICGHPAYVRAACIASLQRLGLDCIDLYYQHRIDTRVPIEVTGLRHRLVGLLALGRPRARIGTHILRFLRRSRSFHPCEVQMGELKKLVEEGKIKYVGLSEASASTIRRAHTVHPITAIQLEWSLWSRDIEEEIIPTCRELGIGIVAYSPLGRGFLSSGPKMVEKLSEDDFRKFLPRFQPGNLEQNGWIFDHVNEMATRKGCTPSQLALAWVHHQGVDVCPIPGTTKVENLEQNIGALSVKLTPVEMSELESFATADSVKGDRYPSMEYTWMYSDTPPPPSRKTE